MIKYFCDECGREITRNYVDERIKLKRGCVTVEIQVAIDGRWNNGEVCKICIEETVGLAFLLLLANGGIAYEKYQDREV